jgi:hypothetical protein
MSAIDFFIFALKTNESLTDNFSENIIFRERFVRNKGSASRLRNGAISINQILWPGMKECMKNPAAETAGRNNYELGR